MLCVLAAFLRICKVREVNASSSDCYIFIQSRDSLLSNMLNNAVSLALLMDLNPRDSSCLSNVRVP